MTKGTTNFSKIGLNDFLRLRLKYRDKIANDVKGLASDQILHIGDILWEFEAETIGLMKDKVKEHLNEI